MLSTVMLLVSVSTVPVKADGGFAIGAVVVKNNKIVAKSEQRRERDKNNLIEEFLFFSKSFSFFETYFYFYFKFSSTIFMNSFVFSSITKLCVN